MDFDYEYRDYQSKIDNDGRTVYFNPESPKALYTTEGLPKDAKVIQSTPKKAPVKVTPSKNPTVDYYKQQVQAKEQAFKESVASDKHPARMATVTDD